MDEMNLLTSMRDEVPLAPPSPAAQRLFRAGLAEDSSPERVRAMRPQTRYLPGAAGTPGRLRWRLAIPGVAAVGLAAALVAVNLPQHGGTPAGQATVHPAAGTTMSAQLLADIAGKGILSHQQPVKPDQWIYQKIETYSANPPGAPSRAKLPGARVQVQTQWTTADGAQTEYFANGHLINELVLNGPDAKVNEQDEQFLADAARKYSQLSSLPKDPAALYAYLAPKHARSGMGSPQSRPYKPGATPAPAKASKGAGAKPTPADSAESVFTTIENMLSSGILPPTLTAELYHTLADIPGIIAKKNVKDFTGRSAVEFILPQSAYSVNLGIFLSPATYQYLGQASWPSPPYQWHETELGLAGPGPFNETVLLVQALVSAPGELP